MCRDRREIGHERVDRRRVAVRVQQQLGRFQIVHKGSEGEGTGKDVGGRLGNGSGGRVSHQRAGASRRVAAPVAYEEPRLGRTEDAQVGGYGLDDAPVQCRPHQFSVEQGFFKLHAEKPSFPYLKYVFLP